MCTVKGKDHLTMNEPSRPERDICDFPDLLSYDIPYWQYQESHDVAILEEMETPKYIAKAPDKYVSKFYGDWVRLYVDGIFIANVRLTSSSPDSILAHPMVLIFVVSCVKVSTTK